MFVTGSDESGRDHVADKSACPSLLLLCRSLSAQSSPTSKFGWLLSCLVGRGFEIFLQPFCVFHASKKCLHFITHKAQYFCYFTFLSLVFMSLEPNCRHAVTVDFDVRDGVH